MYAYYKEKGSPSLCKFSTWGCSGSSVALRASLFAQLSRSCHSRVPVSEGSPRSLRGLLVAVGSPRAWWGLCVVAVGSGRSFRGLLVAVGSPRSWGGLCGGSGLTALMRGSVWFRWVHGTREGVCVVAVGSPRSWVGLCGGGGFTALMRGSVWCRRVHRAPLLKIFLTHNSWQNREAQWYYWRISTYCPWRFVGIYLHTLWKLSSGGPPIMIHVPLVKLCKPLWSYKPPHITYNNSLVVSR